MAALIAGISQHVQTGKKGKRRRVPLGTPTAGPGVQQGSGAGQFGETQGQHSVIPETDKPDCPDCARSGGSYDMACRGCVGRWLRFLRSLKAGETAFQSWCRAAAKAHTRAVVAGFLKEMGVRGYV